MNYINKKLILTLSVGLVSGLAITSIHGCSENLLEQCGLACDGDAFINGQANVSGVAGIDAFFGAAIDLNTAMTSVNADLRAELDAIAVSVGLEPGAGGADIAAGVKAYLSGYIEGGLKVEAQPPRCEASVEASVNAAAECDVDVKPGSVKAECKGTCQAEASAEVDCGAEAEVVCTGTAPNLECSGTCSGTCTVEGGLAASCEGVCRGECKGECSLTNKQGDCEGTCEGTCNGTCSVEMKAGAECEGKCEGSCEYTPPDAKCEADAQVSCKAMGEASIECEGKCEGEVTPPEVSAECEATVEAKASASVECFPPTLDITWQWKAGVEGDLDAQAQFKAWLEGFRARLSAIAALRARGTIIVDAAGNLTVAGKAAMEAYLEELQGEASLKASAGAICALGQLPTAFEAIVDASAELSASVGAATQLSGEFIK